MVIRRVAQTGQQLSSFAPESRTVDGAAARSIVRNRREVRSRELVQAVQSLDTTTDPQMMQAVMHWIDEEYERRQGGRLVGLFGRCYLGAPYVDHRFDLSGSMILEHFTRDQEPPPPFGAARPFARSDAYVFIEVYDDGAVVPIRVDGRPVL